jgi:outer membrane protein TolC
MRAAFLNPDRRAAWWITAAGAALLPACSVFDRSEPFDPMLQKSTAALASPPKKPERPILPASAELPPPRVVAVAASPDLPAVPPAEIQGKPLPINLATALSLSGASPLDIGIAEARVRAASAGLDRANVLWLPNINLGIDYFRHDGQIQDIVGNVFTTSKSSFLLGAGPQAVFATSDAIYAPLAARQVVRARQAEAQAVRNDTTLRVAESYFNVQQARGELAGSIDALRRADQLVARIEKLAPALTPDVEINRARAEAARRRQAVEAAYERWQVAGAELTRLLRLEPGTLVEPAEEPSLKVELIDPAAPLVELVPMALTYRPELAASQAVIQAALARVRQEKSRPYTPTVVMRGVGSNTPGIAGGYFGGGVNDDLQNFGARFSVDLQAVWELESFGFGNHARVREREAESRRAFLELLRTQDIVTAEVVQARARVQRAERRLEAAKSGLADAVETADKNVLGLGQTKRVGEQLVLIFRPQEAVAAVSSLDQAYRDYYAAVADHNRAQFQLYRALGHPAQMLGMAPGAEPPVPEQPPAPPEEPKIPKAEPAAVLPPPTVLPDIAPRSGQPQLTAPVSVYPVTRTGSSGRRP